MGDCCGDNRFTLIERAKKDFIENTNISDAELAVLDRMCFRMWQLGLLKKYEDIDEQKLDELARDFSTNTNIHCKDYGCYYWDDVIEGFKAGYRKAKSE